MREEEKQRRKKKEEETTIARPFLLFACVETPSLRSCGEENALNNEGCALHLAHNTRLREGPLCPPLSGDAKKFIQEIAVDAEVVDLPNGRPTGSAAGQLHRENWKAVVVCRGPKSTNWFSKVRKAERSGGFWN